LAKEALVGYDSEEDILYVYSVNRRASDSLDLEDYIIDFDKRGDIVGIEIMGASKVLSKLFGSKITPEELEIAGKQTSLRVFKTSKFVYVSFTLKFKRREIVVQSPVLPRAVAAPA